MDGRTTTVDLVVLLSENFHNGQAEAAKIVVENADQHQLKAQAWDLALVVCQYLTSEQEAEEPKVVNAAEQILVHLTTVANVKELLIVLLEQADNHKDDTKFKGLLTAIQQCILRLPGKRGHSIGISLETLYAHIQRLPLPADMRLEGKERVLLEVDSSVLRCVDVLMAFLGFVEPIVDEYHWKRRINADENMKNHSQKVAMDITKYLLKVLNHPLGYLDISHGRKEDKDQNIPHVKSGARLCAEKLVCLISRLQSNFPRMVVELYDEDLRVSNTKKQRKRKRELAELGGEDSDDDDLNVEDLTPILGLSVFSYLAFGELVAPDNIPSVLSHEFILDLNCTHINFMLDSKENLIIFKGVTMFSQLVDRIPTSTLSGQLLELTAVKELLQTLLKVMTTAKVKELAQTAVAILKSVLAKFDISGRHQFLCYIMNTAGHTGLLGLTITLMKDEVAANLLRSPPDESFRGVKLKKLLNFAFALPDGDKSDLLEQSERIMAALNLLRYLVIRDKTSSNITGIWDQVDHIRESFCEVLHKAINLSRAHYQLELQKTRQTKKGKKRPDLTFTVQDKDVAGLNKAQQLEVLKMAVHTFDMMESILGRVTEVVDQQRKQLPSVTADTSVNN